MLITGLLLLLLYFLIYDFIRAFNKNKKPKNIFRLFQLPVSLIQKASQNAEHSYCTKGIRQTAIDLDQPLVGGHRGYQHFRISTTLSACASQGKLFISSTSGFRHWTNFWVRAVTVRKAPFVPKETADVWRFTHLFQVHSPWLLSVKHFKPNPLATNKYYFSLIFHLFKYH